LPSAQSAQSRLGSAEQARVSQSPYGHDPRRDFLAPQPAFAPGYPQLAPPTSGMAVASLVLGIVGVLGGWCTFAVPCILAVIFGYVGLGQTRSGARRGRGMAIAGLVLGVVPMAVLVVILIFGGIGALLAPMSSASSRMSGDSVTSEQTPAPRGKGVVVALEEPLTIKLADGHYLRLGMALQLAAGQSDQLDTSAAIRLAVDEYTGREIGELETERGRDAAKQDLVESTAEAYRGAVIDVYFTQFVAQ
jgi:flagellar basal body-associated protein FliL